MRQPDVAEFTQQRDCIFRHVLIGDPGICSVFLISSFIIVQLRVSACPVFAYTLSPFLSVVFPFVSTLRGIIFFSVHDH